MTIDAKPPDEFLTDDVRTVITVCGNADQVCPMFPGQMQVFRRARDEIARVFQAYAAGLLDAAK